MKWLLPIVLLAELLLPGRVNAQRAPADIPARLIARLQEMTDEQAMSMDEHWGIPEVYVGCTGAPATKPGEVPVLACNWGKGANVRPDGHVLLSREGKRWLSRPYPSEGLRGKAQFRRIYQSGNELVVLMDVAPVETRYAEQPHLLRRTGSDWEMVWLPAPDEWSTTLARVTFLGDCLNHFRVDTDRGVLPPAELRPFGNWYYPVVERWERRGNKYVRITRTEPPTAQTALLHFGTALVKGDEAEALRWAADISVIKLARETGLVREAAQGFRPPQWARVTEDRVEFIVKARTLAEQPRWTVTVERRQGRWVVTRIE